MTLRRKQYGEYRLSVLNDRREFMQLILTNSDSLYCLLRRVAILCSKQYGEYRLSAVNNRRESMKVREYLIKFEANFEHSKNTE